MPVAPTMCPCSSEKDAGISSEPFNAADLLEEVQLCQSNKVIIHPRLRNLVSEPSYFVKQPLKTMGLRLAGNSGPAIDPNTLTHPGALAVRRYKDHYLGDTAVHT